MSHHDTKYDEDFNDRLVDPSDEHFIRETSNGKFQVVNRLTGGTRYTAISWENAMCFITDNWGSDAIVDE